MIRREIEYLLNESWRVANLIYLRSKVRHERALGDKFIRGVRSCAEDEGRPLEAGLQEQASNHLKLLW
jgi:hypothetical protein